MSNNNTPEEPSRDRSSRLQELDPYAGEYPPPPPFLEHDLAIEENHPQLPRPQPFYIVDPTVGSNTSSNSVPSSFRQEVRQSEPILFSSFPSLPRQRQSDPNILHTASSFQQQQQFSHESNATVSSEPQALNPVELVSSNNHMDETRKNSDTYRTNSSDYNDPEAVSLREYLEQERREKRQRQQQQDRENAAAISTVEPRISTSTNSDDGYNRQQHSTPRLEAPLYYNQHQQQQSFYHDSNSDFNHPTAPALIAVAHPPPPPSLQSPSAPFSPHSHYATPFRHPSGVNMMPPPPNLIPPPPPNLMPLPPPVMPVQHDKHSLYANRRDLSCCYRMSISSYICMLFFVVLLLCGVAVIVAQKILGDKCSSSTNFRNHNTILCGQPLHDGFLYGGIGAAGVSVLYLAWLVSRCCCGTRYF